MAAADDERAGLQAPRLALPPHVAVHEVHAAAALQRFAHAAGRSRLCAIDAEWPPGASPPGRRASRRAKGAAEVSDIDADASDASAADAPRRRTAAASARRTRATLLQVRDTRRRHSTGWDPRWAAADCGGRRCLRVHSARCARSWQRAAWRRACGCWTCSRCKRSARPCRTCCSSCAASRRC
eukprot:scaffold723_cov363-Prasinococcus_capsulatus_cf.AAC.3